MKKLLIVLLISSGLSFTAVAQGRFSLGPNAGLGHSWVTNFNNSKFKLAANAGVSLVYSATEHFGIGLDAKYSFEGVKGPGANNAVDLNYFRLPLKAIYFFNDYGDKLRPKIYLGPSFGFLSAAKAGDADVKKYYNSSDIALTAGAGFNYRLVRNAWFNADLNYLNGLSNIVKNSSEKVHNRNIGINVGVNFGL
jgi:outer membrane protein W